MKLGIFGRDTDPTSTRLEAVARARGHEVLRIAFAALSSGAAAAFDGDAWRFRGEEIGRCDAFVVRQIPAEHALLGPPQERTTAAEWYVRGVHQRERLTFAESAIFDLELRGKPMVNPLVASRPFEHKPLQLATWRRAGLPVPRTCVTTVPDDVRAFDDDVRRRGGRSICKPISGGAAARLVDEDVLAALDALAEAPAIFQERVPGDDVRATIVGDRVVSSVIIESDALDYRADPAYRRGEARWLVHALPADVEALVLRAASLCGHVLSGVDLKRRGPDDYVLLEANSAPVYLDVEDATGAPITASILDWLEARRDLGERA
jgi:glutathione synthase/RimK-type ligase-like ATP-grasp enzyme